MIRVLKENDVQNFSSTILENVISEYDDPKILIVGPTDSPFLDPTVVCVANICAQQGKGSVTVVDLSSYTKFEPEFKKLKRFGIPVAPTQFRGADILSLPWPATTFDIIIDHFTLFYIVGSPTREFTNIEDQAITEYFRVLKRNGIYLFFYRGEQVFSPRVRKLLRFLRRNARSQGYKLKQQEISDEYLITIPNFEVRARDVLHSKKNAAHCRIRTSEGKQYLVIEDLCNREDVQKDPELVSYNGKLSILGIATHYCTGALLIRKT